MRYFTKEFYKLRRLHYELNYIRKSNLAERYDEEIYKKLYAKKQAVYIREEKRNIWYSDPAEDLRMLEKYVSEENISDEERTYREDYKNFFLKFYNKRIENGTVYKFDKKHCKLKFAESQKQLIALYGNLPEEIKEKIADIRVLALGYASGEVKKLLRRYCAELNRTLNEIELNAKAVTKEAESHLTNKLGFDFWIIGAIENIEEKGGDIYINCERHYFVIKNGKITEGQCKPLYPYYYEKKPDTHYSQVLTTELCRKKDLFELKLLICNFDELEREELWYLTITGTDILKIRLN